MAVYKHGRIYHYDFRQDGIRYHGSTGKTTKSQAETWVSEYRVEIAGGQVEARGRKAPVLSFVANRFLDEMKKRHEAGNLDYDTLRYYRNGWRMLEDTRVAGMRIDRIGTNDAATIKFSHSAWNAQNGQKTLRRILGWCAEKGYIQAAPRIRKSRAKGRTQRITPEIAERLLQHMDELCADVFTISLDSGQRPDEVIRMQWENIDWDNTAYLVEDGKTEASRRFVPISDRVFSILRRRQAEVKADPKTKFSPWVFPSPRLKDRHISYFPIAKGFSEAREAAGLSEKIVLYCARHEFASSFLEHAPGDRSAALPVLKKLLGHTSLATTERYLHPDIQGAADVVNRRNRTKKLKVVKTA